MFSVEIRFFKKKSGNESPEVVVGHVRISVNACWLIRNHDVLTEKEIWIEISTQIRQLHSWHANLWGSYVWPSIHYVFSKYRDEVQAASLPAKPPSQARIGSSSWRRPRVVWLLLYYVHPAFSNVLIVRLRYYKNHVLRKDRKEDHSTRKIPVSYQNLLRGCSLITGPFNTHDLLQILLCQFHF